jgi:hypothetical protein
MIRVRRRRALENLGRLKRLAVLAAGIRDLSCELGKLGTSDGSFVSSAALVHVDFEVCAADRPVWTLSFAGSDVSVR